MFVAAEWCEEVAGLDPDLHTASDARVVMEELARLERTAAAAKVRFARRVAQTDVWQGDRDRTAAHWLARMTGCTVSGAVDQLQTAEKIESLPEVAEAFRSGALSPIQAKHIADAATADPSKEADMLAMAETQSVGEIVAETRRIKGSLGDQDARHDAIRRSRRLTRGCDTDGAYTLTLRHTPDTGAQINAWVEPFIDAIFRRARAAGQREPRAAYAADALVEMLRIAASGEGTDLDLRNVADAKVIVHVPYDTFLVGEVTDGKTCEIEGVGPVPVSVVDEILEANPFLAAVVTRGVDIGAVVHFGRRPNALQMTALQARGVRCTNLGCPNTARLEADHRIDWAVTKHTRFDQLDLLCPPDHRRKTVDGWQLEPGTGRRRLLSPDHPDLNPFQPRSGPPAARAALEAAEPRATNKADRGDAAPTQLPLGA
jgi:hypothetical protein